MAPSPYCNKIGPNWQLQSGWYTLTVRGFKLPERLKHFLTPGIILLSLLFLTAGVYFWNQSLTFLPKTDVGEDKGAVSGAQTGLPKNFPGDIPLFEPAEILSSLESQERIQITLQAEASAERVAQFYQQEMEGVGWKLTGVLTFEKGQRHTQITITPDPTGPTLIIINTIP